MTIDPFVLETEPLCEPSTEADVATGYFYLMLIMPDVSEHRVKVGFATTVAKRKQAFATVSPTIKVIKSWPCPRSWELPAIREVELSASKQLSREVFDVASVEALVAFLDGLFASGCLDGFVSSRLQVTLRDHFLEPGEACAQHLGLTNLSELANIALREKLEHEGFWPPPAKSQAK